MATYSLELKENIVRKMMPPYSERIAELSAQYGISKTTLYNWRNQYRAKGHIVPNRKTTPNKWDTKSKLAVVIKTAAMNQADEPSTAAPMAYMLNNLMSGAKPLKPWVKTQI